MEKFTNGIPFFKITVAFITGILAANFLPGIPAYFLVSLVMALIFLYIRISRIKTTGSVCLASATLMLIVALGGFIRRETSVKAPASYNGDCYHAFLTEYPVAKTNSLKAELMLTEVVKGDSVFRVSEKIIAYFKPDSLSEKLAAGDRILFKAIPEEITNQGNPYEFDYKKYLSRKKIFRQIYLPSGKWLRANTPAPFSPKISAEKIRARLLNIYRENNIADEQFAILSALTLGYKDALNPEIKSVFAGTGATHVLSVSGLHVGIIFLLLNVFLKPLKQGRGGRPVFVGLILLSVWFYSLLTGFSPSVLRSAVMFSFIVVGENMRKPTNIYNTLALSAFILLVIDPQLIFDIGCQLSYSAVLGIVYFHPKIYNLLHFRRWLPDQMWSLLVVSITAQITTFPLALYYFNQFPVYFWLSNYIVVPASFFLIFLGITIILLSPVHILSSFLAKIVSYGLWIIYELLEGICQLPCSLIENISIDGLQLTLLFLSVICAMYFTTKLKANYLIGIISLFILFYGINIFRKAACSGENEIIVYNSPENTVLHLLKGRENYVIFCDTVKPNPSELTNIKNVQTAKFLKPPEFVQMNNGFEDKNLFIKNKVISFLGENILVEPEEKNIPEISFRFCLSEFPDTSLPRNTIIISPVQRLKKGFVPDSVFLLKKEGAFRYIF